MNDQERLAELAKHWYGLATVAQRAAGSVWYSDARVFCVELAYEYRMDVQIVAGVVAALSPAVYWNLNKRQAEALVQAYSSEGMESAKDVVLSTYGRQADKAYRILRLQHTGGGDQAVIEADIIDILGPQALKTRAFYRGIVNPSCAAVCIDRHMIRALRFEDRWTRGNGMPKRYNLLANAVRTAAEELGVEPTTLQATIWITYKETADAYSAAEQGHQSPVRTRGQDARDLPV